MTTVYIKICGLSDPGTAGFAVRAGADAIGVVMSEPSPRHASPDTAREVIAAARAVDPETDTVLVVREMPAPEAAGTALQLGFDVLQLHGRYSPDDFSAARAVLPRVWRATSLAAEPEVRAGAYGEERLLLDGAAAGSGERWDLGGLAPERLGSGWLLAGGLDPDNVAAAIDAAHPGGVDVSSGVESAPGRKDLGLIERFIRSARAADGIG